jgi:purine nucleosidase
MNIKRPVIIDADTANEVDDLYAIVRALIAPELDVRGLSSVQWQSSHYATPNTLEDSQRLNEVLLSLLNMSHIPHPRGAANRLYDFGADVAQHSAAAYHIIREAQNMPEGERLTVLALGALTNVASALLIEPSIAKKISLYHLGTSYDFHRQVWNKIDFNCVMDIQAINVVLNAEELDTHILPMNIAFSFQFPHKEMKQRLDASVPVLEFLLHRWYNHMDGARMKRVLWDLALVELFLNPEWGTEVQVTTPPENTQRKVSVYQWFDVDKTQEDFYEAVKVLKG